MTVPVPPIRKILVPLDFSDFAQHAFAVALQLAQKSGARLKLLHVVAVPLAGSAGGAFFSGLDLNSFTAYQTYDSLLPELLDQATQQLEKLTQTGRENGVTVEPEVVVDLALTKILNVVTEEQINLVVIGSEGADGLEEFLIGSDAEELVRQCPCPVLTIKQKHEPFQIDSLLFPSDFAPEVAAMIPYITYFQHFFGARLHLLYVRTKNDQATAGAIHELMQAFVAQNELTNVNLLIQPHASASDGITTAATKLAHALILMPTHGRTGFAQLFHKSITESVVNHASMPVLTLHWPATAE